MKLKKIITSVLLAITILISASTFAYANTDVEQVISNQEIQAQQSTREGAPSTTKSVALNQNNTFKVEGQYSTTEWVKFTVTENGYVTINLDKALFAGGKEGTVEAKIQDESGKYVYLDSSSTYTKLGDIKTNQWKIGLKPDTYYMKLYADFGTGSSFMNLNYKVGFTKHNNFEMEGYWRNIDLNTTYVGISNEDGYTYSTDYDHYKFEVKEDGHYILNINHELNKNYYFDIKDRYDNTVYSFYSSRMNSIDGRNYSYTLSDLTPGDYYLTMSNYGSDIIQDEYTFSVSKSKHGWEKQGSYWYYYDKGIIQTDWRTIDEKEYFFDSTGKMQTGWLNDYGTWYYLGTNGAKHKGWLQQGGNWYYLDEYAGIMETGMITISGKIYYFNDSGIMFNQGWKKVSGYYYFFESNGRAKTGWHKESRNWYYMNSYGKMVTQKITIGSNTYLFDNNGKMQTGWIKYNGDYYYANSNGTMKTGWYKEKGKWYFLHTTYGYMATGKWYINGDYNYFDQNGVWQY